MWAIISAGPGYWCIIISNALWVVPKMLQSSNNKEQYSIKRRYCIHYECTVRHSSDKAKIKIAKVKSRLVVSSDLNWD